ncbi:MAG: pseudouridine synthase [Acutalibacteraceae bacterium]|nr:pseudouridine synthase [Acutalibacteraceae bacterium]
MSLERLDKLLASRGTASRSDVKKLIAKGRVTVNGVVVKNSNVKVNSEQDIIVADGKTLDTKEYIYLMMNKPAGVVSATEDNFDKTVIDIIPQKYRRKGLFPVGRLDKDTEGLLIITNDGDFAHKVMSPKHNVYKTYYAEIDKPIDQSDIEAFQNGIVFKDGTVCKKAFLQKIADGEHPVVEVKICEGKFHQVKKMLLSRGKKVVYLKRTAIGKLKLDVTLNKGEVKNLSILDINNIFIDDLH